MAYDDGLAEVMRGELDGIEGITERKMFGGLSIYSGGQIFAIIGPQDRIYIKARDELAEALADEGAEQFVYHGSAKKEATMNYWSLPEAAIDDPAEACAWARRSLEQNA